MAGFKQLSGLVVPLDAANVDTDAIIPKQFLQAITRVGFGKHLFHEWRYLDVEGTKPNPDFVLNYPQYQGATILLARKNLGCGSSRTKFCGYFLQQQLKQPHVTDSFKRRRSGRNFPMGVGK